MANPLGCDGFFSRIPAGKYPVLWIGQAPTGRVRQRGAKEGLFALSQGYKSLAYGKFDEVSLIVDIQFVH
jgi:hypothetical protein